MNISLTPNAILHVKQLLAKKPNALGFRLSVKTTGCSGMAYLPTIIDTVIADDISFLADDVPVFVDPKALPYIDGLVIDYVTEESMGLKQKRMVFINPNEKGRCGCGESFTVD